MLNVILKDIDFTGCAMCVHRFDNLLNSVVLSLTQKKKRKLPEQQFMSSSDVVVVSDLMLLNLYLFLSLCHVDMSHSVFAIEDRGDLLESGAFSLDEDEVNPDRFKYIPTLQTQTRIREQRSSKTSEGLRKVDLTVYQIQKS